MRNSGLTSRLTSGGLPVLRCHYSADASKDPDTPEGAAWVKRAASSYALGTRDPAWLQEYEIVYGALGGTLLFRLWDAYKPYILISPRPLQHLPYAKLYGTYDHGWIHPAAYHVHAVLPDGRKFTIWEFAASQVPMRAIAEIIKGQGVILKSDGRRFDGNPYAGKEVVRIADPAIFERRGVTGDDPHASVGDIYRQKYGVAMERGTRGGDLTVASYLIGDLWLDPEQPKYQIFSTCPHLIWELPRLRHRQISSSVGKTKATPEDLVDKDNDAWDSLKQFLRRFPSTVAPTPPRQMAGTFAHAQKMLHARKPLANRYARR